MRNMIVKEENNKGCYQPLVEIWENGGVIAWAQITEDFKTIFSGGITPEKEREALFLLKRELHRKIEEVFYSGRFSFGTDF